MRRLSQGDLGLDSLFNLTVDNSSISWVSVQMMEFRFRNIFSLVSCHLLVLVILYDVRHSKLSYSNCYRII